MSATVWKFPLYITDTQFVRMPDGAEILHVDLQDGLMCLWAKVDPDASEVDRRIHVSGTGNPCPDDARHVGSVLMPPLVWHVWEDAA